jgi:hypothetical protein
MSLPILFRPLASLELNEAIAWYEKQQPGLGMELKAEVDHFLSRIAKNPDHFRRIRGSVRRALLRRFPYTIHFLEEPQSIYRRRGDLPRSSGSAPP